MTLRLEPEVVLIDARGPLGDSWHTLKLHCIELGRSSIRIPLEVIA